MSRQAYTSFKLLMYSFMRLCKLEILLTILSYILNSKLRFIETNYLNILICYSCSYY